ncbi:MAG: hypothetical protein ACFB5Z_14835 [Elainellaceae cyanobacterium]
MDSIQIDKIDSTYIESVREDILYIQQHFDDILRESDRILINNLFQHAEFSLAQVDTGSKSFREKAYIFQELTNNWFDVYQLYRDIPEAMELLKSLNHLSNYSIAYTYLCLGLADINEDRTGKYIPDLERIVAGLQRLSETVDVFISFFSESELRQICSGCKNIFSNSIRDVASYFEDGFEVSSLITQLRAFASLTILKVETHLTSPIMDDDEIELDEDATDLLAARAALASVATEGTVSWEDLKADAGL